MKQLIQNFKSGELYVDDVPAPALSKGLVLIENKISLISSGTERGTVKVGQASLLGKARQRPDLVAQVVKNIKKEGLSATLKKVQTKLDSLKALGYSSAGVVMASMDEDKRFRPGDRVACAGQDYASHAEVVSVPQNLVARIPDNVSFEEASFTTLGAIALQGVRQTEPRLGESICVIGLGLLGQLTCQLLRANGCRVLGIDLSERLVTLAKQSSTENAINRSDSNLIKYCENFTRGYGFDSVIITAAAPTNDPIELAAEISRKKGKVVIVGAVKMDVPRDPHFYRKELDLRMSCSYGPGRYDTWYEEEGRDYPYAYVRWTEQRNMEAFLDLLSRKAIDVKSLITHSFDIEKAEDAFDLVMGKTDEPSVGILLKYPERAAKSTTSVAIQSPVTSAVTVGFIGAGSFAQSYLIPNLKSKASLHTVVTSKGITSKNVAQKFGFAVAGSDPAEIFQSRDINTVFIATPHNSHAELTAKALLAGKHVFVEKPLSIDYEGIKAVQQARQSTHGKLMVGFNRRFSPLAVAIKNAICGGGGPLMMNFRVNAGFIPKEHWIQKEDIGGGRIVGEMCHFIDLMQFFADSHPVSVFAQSIQPASVQQIDEDTVAVTVRFENGSVGSLVYAANGDTSLPKEQLELFADGKVGVINDFQQGSIYKNNKETAVKGSGKGHRHEVEQFISAIKGGPEQLISFDEILYTTLTCLKIRESLATGMPQEVSLDLPA